MKLALSFYIFLSLFFMKQINAQIQPQAVKKDTLLSKHGHTRTDSYFWMNQRDSKKVLDYIKEENVYSENYFRRLNSLQNNILNEFETRIDPNEVSAPFVVQERFFQLKNSSGKDYQDIFLIQGDQQILFFNQNARANNKNYYDLGDWMPSPNNQLLAFSEDYTGRRKYTIYIRNEKTSKILKDEIKNTDGSLIWGNDNKTLFYVKKDEQTLREFQVYRHTLGTNTKSDVLVYEEKDERFSVYISKSLTGKYIQIHSQSSTTNEIRCIDADKPKNEALIFLPRENGHLYELDDHDLGFFVTSNKNAKNNQILLYKKWPNQEGSPIVYLEHDSQKLIEGVLPFKHFLVIQSRSNGLQQLEIINFKNNERNTVQMSEETYSLSIGQNDQYEISHFYYIYSSLTTPSSVYKYNFLSKQSELFFRKNLIDPNFSPQHYESRRVWATANDGTQIPISFVYRKGIDLSKAPLLLYGYGSYGITISANFDAMRLSLIDRGFVYAIAHVRGGKYLGEEWYENGKFLQKKNTFTDFINCAEYLSMKSYCHPEKIYAQGGSAGGMLMGAVLNMAPYLWKGVVAQVPFVDVVSTMIDETIPLTVGEYEEWGNPNDEMYYYYMLSYSPYDNVKKMAYPALFITSGYHDSQVQYWEPLKWIAKLRELRTNTSPLLLDCNIDAGHSGGSGRSNSRRELAKEYSFILDLEGIEK